MRQLERLATKAHAAGQPWGDFWECHGKDIAAAEPWDRQRFARLVRRLLGLVVSGDVAGQEPIGDLLPEPWESDDQPPSDSTTAARIDWTAAGVVPLEVPT